MFLRMSIISIFLLMMTFTVNLYAGYTNIGSTFLTAEVTVLGRGAEFIHNSPDRINITKDQIVLSAELPGISAYTNIDLWYRVNNTTVYKKIDFSPPVNSGTVNYSGIAVIPANEVTVNGVEYYINAQGPNIADFEYHTDTSPEVIPYIEKETLIYSKNNNVIKLKDGNIYDGEASLELNGYSEKSVISFKQVQDLNNIPKNNNADILKNMPVAAYQIEPLNIKLTEPAQLKLLYIDINQDGKDDYADIDESILKVYWFDGFDWRYMGGTVNSMENIVAASIFSFGLYGLFPITKIDETMYKPLEKMITPNKDGINDYLIFSGLSGDYEIKIVDIRGNLIRSINNRPYWDGKDANGDPVPGGVYFYQLKVNGKTIKGVLINVK